MPPNTAVWWRKSKLMPKFFPKGRESDREFLRRMRRKSKGALWREGGVELDWGLFREVFAIRILHRLKTGAVPEKGLPC